MTQRNNLPGGKEPRPYHFYTIPVFILLLFGLGDSIYLTYLHVQNYTNVTFSSFCALSKSINCDTVSQSPWSILLGVPLALWGVGAYVLFLVIFLAALRQTRESQAVWYVLCFLGALYSVASLYFSYISSTKINAYCILCLLSYTINFSLLFFCLLILRRYCSDSFVSGLVKGTRYLFRRRTPAICIITLFLSFFLLRFLISPYWLYSFPGLSTDVAHGITEEGHHWIGAENPTVTIHEFADYQCFQCGKMHLFLRQLVSQNPETLRLVHHHYPMDHKFNSLIVPEPFHIGSGKMAMIAIYAGTKGNFWEMNDALYSLGREKQSFNTRTLAAMTGFSPRELAAATRNQQIREFLLADIRRGMRYEIIGTPSYVIDDQVYQGSLPPEILRSIMQ